MTSTHGVADDQSLLKTAETEQFRILKVPNEILGMIAAECDLNDLKNLRLTSKFMCEVSIQAFGCKAFSRRRFIFTRKSMQGLLDITAHPVFGPHLRVITFGTCRLEASALEIHEDVDWEPYSSSHMNDVTLASYKVKEAQHKTFVQKNGHIEMLTLALENLQSCSNTSVHLGVHDDSFSYQVKRRAYGFQDSYDTFIPTEFEGVETLSAIFAASIQNQYPLEAIKVFVSQDNFVNLLEGSDILWNLFHDQDTNESILCPDMDIHIGIRLTATYANMKILSAGTRLELYSHSFEHDADGNPYLKFFPGNYEFIWEATASSQLQDILIDKSHVEYDLFTQFLKGQAESLEDLVLRNVHMVALRSPTEHTLKLLRFLKDDLRLESVTLECLTVGQSIAIPESGKVVFEGKVNVSRGLEDLIEEVDVLYEDEPESSDDSELTSSE